VENRVYRKRGGGEEKRKKGRKKGRKKRKASSVAFPVAAGDREIATTAR
jgi:hypothetical protein